MLHVWKSIQPWLTFAGGIITLASVLTTASIDFIEHRFPRTRPKQRLRVVAIVFSICGTLIMLVGSHIEGLEQARLQGEIAKLSGETLTWVTGGEDGFVDVQAVCFANDQNRITFLVHNGGQYPAYDVAIKFRDMDARHEYDKAHTTSDNLLRFNGTFSAFVNESDAIGTIYWNRSIMYPDPIHLMATSFEGKPADKRSFYVQVYTRNGYEEMSVLAARIAKPDECGWRFAYKVENKRLLGKDFPNSEKHDVGFPLDASGRVAW